MISRNILQSNKVNVTLHERCTLSTLEVFQALYLAMSCKSEIKLNQFGMQHGSKFYGRRAREK